MEILRWMRLPWQAYVRLKPCDITPRTTSATAKTALPTIVDIARASNKMAIIRQTETKRILATLPFIG
ncbi:MAG TPA: hypothetical protein VMG09_10960 [Bacteroidota bacterium]|nr:hypothetical protein [Bacteroidota bacterium]